MFHIWEFNLVGTTNDVFKRFKILWNIWGLSLVLSGISRSKVKKWKIPEGFQKSISLAPWPPPLLFGFFLEYPILVIFTACSYHFLFWRYLNSSMKSFLPEILLRFPNLNNLNSHVFNILARCCKVHVISSQLFKSFEFGNGSRMPDDNLVILSTFTTFLLHLWSVVDADLYFFSLCDIRSITIFLLLEHSSLRGVKQKNHLKKTWNFGH